MKTQITNLTLFCLTILFLCWSCNKQSTTKSYEVRFQTLRSSATNTFPIGDYIDFDVNGKKGNFVVSNSKTYELLLIDIKSGDKIEASMKGAASSHLQISVNERKPDLSSGFGVANAAYGEVKIDVKTPK